MITFEDMLIKAISLDASDVHLSVGIPAACRVRGEIIHMYEEPMTMAGIKEIIDGILNDTNKEKLYKNGEVDFSHSLPGVGRFRINAFRQRSAYSVVARILNSEIVDPTLLGLPEVVLALANKKRGLVLVTGPTGSGKSTTLASLIKIINDEQSAHIITLEDPIEYLHKHNKAIVNQREIGLDSMSFGAALRASLRQDPDVILIGEMRDLETISTAITAAETGHLVFSTLHTIGAANTIDRVIDVFPPHQQQQVRTQLADVLVCVISQQLLPRASGKGRVAALEIMFNTPAVASYIRDAKTYQIATVLQTSRKTGMISMDDSLFDLCRAGTITRAEAIGFSQDVVALTKKLDVGTFSRDSLALTR